MIPLLYSYLLGKNHATSFIIFLKIYDFFLVHACVVKYMHVQLCACMQKHAKLEEGDTSPGTSYRHL